MASQFFLQYQETFFIKIFLFNGSVWQFSIFIEMEYLQNEKNVFSMSYLVNNFIIKRINDKTWSSVSNFSSVLPFIPYPSLLSLIPYPFLVLFSHMLLCLEYSPKYQTILSISKLENPISNLILKSQWTTDYELKSINPQKYSLIFNSFIHINLSSFQNIFFQHRIWVVLALVSI